MNSVNVIGRLGTDPELKERDGDNLCKLRIAVDSGRDDPYWFDVVCWGKTADACAQYLGKGSQVGIEGKLQSRTWEKAGGGKGYAVEINAFRVDFLGGKQEGGAAPQQQRQSKPQAAPKQSGSDIDWTMEDEEDPFADE